MLGRVIGQQAGPADGQEDQRVLRVEQAHGRRARGGHGLDRVDGRLQPPHDQRGRFSNHSIGCAVDINAMLATDQNDHLRLKRTTRRTAARAADGAVRTSSGASRASARWTSGPRRTPRSGSRPPTSSTSTSRCSCPSCSTTRRRDANTVLAELGEAFDWIAGTTSRGRADGRLAGPEQARRRGQGGQEGRKTETAKWLDRLVADWPQVRAWIEGVVIYKEDDPYATVGAREARAARRSARSRATCTA